MASPANAQSQVAFYIAVLAYFLCYSAELFALCTSMSLHHLGRPARHFPVVRACGTMGWIAAASSSGWVAAMTGRRHRGDRHAAWRSAWSANW